MEYDDLGLTNSTRIRAVVEFLQGNKFDCDSSRGFSFSSGGKAQVKKEERAVWLHERGTEESCSLSQSSSESASKSGDSETVIFPFIGNRIWTHLQSRTWRSKGTLLRVGCLSCLFRITSSVNASAALKLLPEPVTSCVKTEGKA